MTLFVENYAAAAYTIDRVNANVYISIHGTKYWLLIL